MSGIKTRSLKPQYHNSTATDSCLSDDRFTLPKCSHKKTPKARNWQDKNRYVIKPRRLKIKVLFSSQHEMLSVKRKGIKLIKGSQAKCKITEMLVTLNTASSSNDAREVLSINSFDNNTGVTGQLPNTAVQTRSHVVDMNYKKNQRCVQGKNQCFKCERNERIRRSGRKLKHHNPV